VPNVSNADILESAYKTRDALIPYIRVMVALLNEQGIPEEHRNTQIYKLADKLGEVSKEVQPQGIVTLTLAYTLKKFLDQVIQSSSP
jgi:hypothetical protein